MFSMFLSIAEKNQDRDQKGLGEKMSTRNAQKDRYYRNRCNRRTGITAIVVTEGQVLPQSL